MQQSVANEDQQKHSRGGNCVEHEVVTWALLYNRITYQNTTPAPADGSVFVCVFSKFTTFLTSELRPKLGSVSLMRDQETQTILERKKKQTKTNNLDWHMLSTNYNSI